ncbi:MAG: hypothetical protein ACXACX_07315 [Candidatus Hodarchaeales archaeon]|jgi:hypothetical protein
MFRSKKKKEEQEVKRKIFNLTNEGEGIINQAITFIEEENYKLKLINDMISILKDWINKWDDINHNGDASIKLKVNNLLGDLTLIESDIKKKNNFLHHLDQFENDLEGLNKKIQTSAKKIPIISTLQDIESINAEIGMVKEDLNSLATIENEFVDKYLSSNERLKYERIIDKRDSTSKKLPIIESNLNSRKEKLEVNERAFDISEEKKKLFNWVDTFDQRSKKYENKVDSLFEQLEDIELIVSLESFKKNISTSKEEINILQPPVVKTPEVKKQIENLSSKFSDKITMFGNRFDELNSLIEKKLVKIIAEKRADRLIRKFLSTKRIPKIAFFELIRSEEIFTTNWLKILPDEEPLRLQETDTLVALSMARVQEGKQLYEYLNEVMNKFTHEEYKEKDLFNETLKKFKEAESFENK